MTRLLSYIIALKPAQIKTFDASPQFPFRRHIGNPGQIVL
jgi:hypothetical protein